MYKVKRFSAKSSMVSKSATMADTLMKNAKEQAIKNPLAAVSLGLVGANSAMNLYNSKQSKMARRKTIKALKKMNGGAGGPNHTENIIIV